MVNCMPNALWVLVHYTCTNVCRMAPSTCTTHLVHIPLLNDRVKGNVELVQEIHNLDLFNGIDTYTYVWGTYIHTQAPLSMQFAEEKMLHISPYNMHLRTSIGLLCVAMSGKSVIALKQTVTSSNCSALTACPCFKVATMWLHAQKHAHEWKSILIMARVNVRTVWNTKHHMYVRKYTWCWKQIRRWIIYRIVVNVCISPALDWSPRVCTIHIMDSTNPNVQTVDGNRHNMRRITHSIRQYNGALYAQHNTRYTSPLTVHACTRAPIMSVHKQLCK